MQYCSPIKSRQRRNPTIEKTRQTLIQTPKKPGNKSVETVKRRRKISLEIKTKFQISPDHLGFLIEEQKNSELKAIRESVSLSHYYQTLLSLFEIAYTSAQVITANMFEAKKQTLGLSNLKFVGLLFSLYEGSLNERNLIRMKVMAKNILKMGKTQKLFQQKVEFICRKVAINFNMRRRIEMCFLNHKLESFWVQLLRKIKYSEQIEMLEDLYEMAPEKMAYWDFTYFVNEYLAQEEFYAILGEQNKHARRQDEGEDTLVHNFTYEFLVIEIFCFHEEMDAKAETGAKKQCQLI